MRALVLAVTLLVLAHMVLFAVGFARAWTTGDDDLLASPAMIGAHVAAFAAVIVLVVTYARDVFKRDLPDDQQAIWAVLMCVTGPLAMVPYWLLHYRRGPGRPLSRSG
ncbi:hypothetical protein C8N24_2292 [Solirubrobacter pauli]|uniref:Uncharacterized protein n=1 Tax=Solirubrobacter pauli TaxID=166793 RepID=A0A660LDT4_9ACTN|nr:hypothetical protein [Solirubrobacter pauli]RKQ92446.1 hypothetical protein C8N24_2292 [Solirubrobacter pauli]